VSTIHLEEIGLDLDVQPESIRLCTPTAVVAVVKVPELTAKPEELHWWMSPRDNVLVMTSKHASQLFRVPLDTGVIKVAADLQRSYSDLLGDEVQFLECTEGPGGELLVLYEAGLVCLDAHGKLRWHRLHHDVTAKFVSVDDGCVVIERHLPADRTERTCFRLEDGREAATG
jgi:hypothetical protein